MERLATALWRHGAELGAPGLQEFATGELRFELRAILPGPPSPRAPEIVLAELWARVGPDRYGLVEYAYDFVERPLGRRRAYHRHDVATFLERFDVTVHEHCEELIGQPACGHYHGLPTEPFEALRRFLVQWGQPGPLGCAALRCIG